MILDDAILLRRYAEERSDEAFAELVRRHLNRVYSSALRRLGGDVQLAQDVTQEVFVALAREAARLSRHPLTTGWLHTTTRNAAANLVRAERRRKTREEEIQRMHETLNPGSTEADWSRLAPVLEHTLDQLSESDRLAVLLRYVEQRTFGDIGRVLNLSEDSARKRADRAIDKLRILLQRRGIVSSAAALGIALTNQVVIAAPAGFAATVTGAALAASPAGAGVSATLFGIMSTTKLAISCAAIAGVIAALGLARYEYHARQVAKASLETAAGKEVSLLAERNALEAQVRAIEADVARLRKEAEDARAAQDNRDTTARADAAKAAVAWDPKKEGTAFLDRHPEARQALRERFLAGVRSTFGALFKTLGLTPAQIEEFASLKINGNAMGGTGFNGKYILYSVDSVDSPSDIRNALHNLLGEQGWQKYKEYSAMLPARDLTTKVASRLSFTDTPITPEQSDQLVTLLASNQSKVPGTSLRQFNWDPILSEASKILSPSQQSALEFSRAEADFELATNLPSQTSKGPAK